jgi:ACT domain-containing protein
MAEDPRTRSYTVRLELVDEPGELLRALEPIAENGGNLLSIFHERGSMTPRGRIPVEVDVECPPERFDRIVDALRDAGVSIIRAGAERYDDHVTVVLTGPLIEAGVSETLTAIEAAAETSVVDLSVTAPAGSDDGASARLRLAVNAEATDAALDAVRQAATERGLGVIEPLPEEAA